MCVIESRPSQPFLGIIRAPDFTCLGVTTLSVNVRAEKFHGLEAYEYLASEGKMLSKGNECLFEIDIFVKGVPIAAAK